MSDTRRTKQFIVLTLLAIHEIFGKFQMSSTCTPRFAGSSKGIPLFWNFFGKTNKGGTGGSKKDIDESSREIDENSPTYEKLKWTTVRFIISGFGSNRM